MRRDLDYYYSLPYPVQIIRRPEGVFAYHPDLDGCAAQGSTTEEALANLDVARRLWLEVRIEDNLPIEEPIDEAEFSGRVSLRMSPPNHAAMAKIARLQGISLNQLLNNAISEYVGGNRLQQQVIETVREIKSALYLSAAWAPTQFSHVPLFSGSARGSTGDQFLTMSTSQGDAKRSARTEATL